MISKLTVKLSILNAPHLIRQVSMAWLSTNMTGLVHCSKHHKKNHVFLESQKNTIKKSKQQWEGHTPTRRHTTHTLKWRAYINKEGIHW